MPPTPSARQRSRAEPATPSRPSEGNPAINQQRPRASESASGSTSGRLSSRAEGSRPASVATVAETEGSTTAERTPNPRPHATIDDATPEEYAIIARALESARTAGPMVTLHLGDHLFFLPNAMHQPTPGEMQFVGPHILPFAHYVPSGQLRRVTACPVLREVYRQHGISPPGAARDAVANSPNGARPRAGTGSSISEHERVQEREIFAAMRDTNGITTDEKEETGGTGNGEAPTPPPPVLKSILKGARSLSRAEAVGKSVSTGNLPSADAAAFRKMEEILNGHREKPKIAIHRASTSDIPHGNADEQREHIIIDIDSNRRYSVDDPRPVTIRDQGLKAWAAEVLPMIFAGRRQVRWRDPSIADYREPEDSWWWQIPDVEDTFEPGPSGRVAYRYSYLSGSLVPECAEENADHEPADCEPADCEPAACEPADCEPADCESPPPPAEAPVVPLWEDVVPPTPPTFGQRIREFLHRLLLHESDQEQIGQLSLTNVIERVYHHPVLTDKVRPFLLKHLVFYPWHVVRQLWVRGWFTEITLAFSIGMVILCQWVCGHFFPLIQPLSFWEGPAPLANGSAPWGATYFLTGLPINQTIKAQELLRI
ncbi:hypothetical protein FN846DRAFT_912707 [Sphaerosporella brunnea]|uniref:Uncharacterized protein n=1 Tax=Sphaerosporella brunnea TaxID=1250544 RepID=A0A5J5EHM3_9PEZI|nr:hypothetical protein FN846DRAFT_912707 [Sphaerosporella brunnea]